MRELRLAPRAARRGRCRPRHSGGRSSGRGQALPTKIGKGEGKLTLIAWEGYTRQEWATPFEKQTGCKVQAKYAGSSDEMVTLMRSGGGAAGPVRHGLRLRRRQPAADLRRATSSP